MRADLRRGLVALALVLLTACGSDDPSTTIGDPGPSALPPQEAGTSQHATAPSPPPAPDPAARSARATDPRLDDVAVTLEPVVELDSPTATALRPGDDALFIAERAGRVRVLRGGRLEDEPLVDVSDRTSVDSERGLLGLAFAPDGEHLYLSFTDTAGDTRVDAYRLDGGRVDVGSARTLLTVEQPFANHNGGHVETGPDGALYLGLGDGGAAGDRLETGQDPTSLLGSVLRIEPTPEADQPYAIPADNPFADGDGGAAEVWLYGVRNPWRFAFDEPTGDLWVADVGQDRVEEVNWLPPGVQAGANLGWDAFEGSLEFEGDPSSSTVGPVFTYPHPQGCSVTGGRVYRGEAVPALRGAYLYGDFCDPQLRALVVRDGEVTQSAPLGVEVDGLVHIGADRAGELYVLSLGGTVFTLVPA